MRAKKRNIDTNVSEAIDALEDLMRRASTDHHGRPLVYWINTWDNQDGDLHDGKAIVIVDNQPVAVSHYVAAIGSCDTYDRDGRFVVRIQAGGTSIAGQVAGIIASALRTQVEGRDL